MSLGDRTVLTQEACGCPLEELGWETHLHSARSFEKLTAAGQTFLDVDVAEVLEQTLPSRFGGTATDFQLVEEEADDGFPRLALIVSPRVGEVDDAAVLTAFLDAPGHGNKAERIAVEQWRDGGVVRVERAEPRTAAGGEILQVQWQLAPRGPSLQ